MPTDIAPESGAVPDAPPGLPAVSRTARADHRIPDTGHRELIRAALSQARR